MAKRSSLRRGGIVLFEPDDGSFRPLVDFDAIEGVEGGAEISLPVPPATFPREVNTATVDNNATGTWIFGATEYVRVFLSGRVSCRADGDSAPMRRW